MTSNVYDRGDKPRLSAAFTAGEVATDPTAVVLIIKLPSGAFESFLSDFGWSDQGDWNPATNLPELADGTGTTGHYYTASAGGSANLGHGSQTWVEGDLVAYDGDVWLRIPSPRAATLTKDSTGNYSFDYPIHIAGRHYYRFEGAGIVHAAEENDFWVESSNIR